MASNSIFLLVCFVLAIVVAKLRLNKQTYDFVYLFGFSNIVIWESYFPNSVKITVPVYKSPFICFGKGWHRLLEYCLDKNKKNIVKILQRSGKSPVAGGIFELRLA